MMMPVMDGTATIQELVRLNPEVRIIAASGLATDTTAAGAAGARVMHFLPKPYTAETLLTAVRAALAYMRCSRGCWSDAGQPPREHHYTVIRSN